MEYVFRIAILLLPLALTTVSFTYTAEQEEACSYGGTRYLCYHYDICSKFGLIDEDAKEALCGTLLEELAWTSFPPGFVSTFPPETEPPTTEFQTSDSAMLTRDAFTGGLTTYPQTEAITTKYFTNAGVNVQPSVGDKRVPVITSLSRNITVAPGDTALFECEAKAPATPQVTLTRKDHVRRPSLESFTTVSGGHTIQVTGNSIRIEKVEKMNEGWYTCLACNRYGCTERDTYLTVLHVASQTPTRSPLTTPNFMKSTTQPSYEDTAVDTPRATCTIFGGPHFLTYDNTSYTYPGMCDSILAMDCEAARWFVYGRMRPCGNSEGSCLEAVTVFVDGVGLELQRGWLVNSNGQKVMPKNRKGEGIIIKNYSLLFDGTILTLSATINTRVSPTGKTEHDKLVIRWDGFVSVQIQTPINTRTCGMCGNNNGRPENDLRTRRGVIVHDVEAFGESWQIDPLGRCSKPKKTKGSEDLCGERYQQVKKKCERVFNISKFQGCMEAGHDPTQFVESCVYDECERIIQRDNLPPKCVVAQAYATQCSNDFWVKGDPFPRRSLDLENWEMEAGCPDETERFQPILDTGCPQPTL